MVTFYLVPVVKLSGRRIEKFTFNSRKCKLKYGDRKEISGCLGLMVGGRERSEGGTSEGHEETFRGDQYIHYLDGDDGFIDVYIYQNSSSCTLLTHTVYCILIIPQ